MIVQNSAQLSVADDFDNQYSLHFAMTYKLLGSHKDCKRSPTLETNFRVG